MRCDLGAAADETEVTVTYDVTPLAPEGVDYVERLRDGYDAFLGSWREEIAAASRPVAREAGGRAPLATL